MSKIYIGGASGSGKTTYSKKIEKEKKLPRLDLDELFWVNSETDGIMMERAVDERTQMVQKFLDENEHWIVEGAYCSEWIEDFLKQADEIIIVHRNVWVRHFRIIRRSYRKKIGKESSKYKDNWKLFWELLKWNHKYDKKIFPEFKERVRKIGKKYRVVKG